MGIGMTRSNLENKSSRPLDPAGEHKNQGNRKRKTCPNRGNKSPYLTRGGIDRCFSMKNHRRILFQAIGRRERERAGERERDIETGEKEG